MPGPLYKAFVSSTYEDLKEHRAYVIDALRNAGIFVDPMEDWTADSDEPKRFSAERVQGCDFCVLLVAFRRGFVPPGESKSITQMEYGAAVDRGMDVLVFLLDEDAPWPRGFDQIDDELKQWRTSLQERHGRSLFGLDPHSIKIAPAVTRWVAKQSGKATEAGTTQDANYFMYFSSEGGWVDGRYDLALHVVSLARNEGFCLLTQIRFRGNQAATQDGLSKSDIGSYTTYIMRACAREFESVPARVQVRSEQPARAQFSIRSQDDKLQFDAHAEVIMLGGQGTVLFNFGALFGQICALSGIEVSKD